MYAEVVVNTPLRRQVPVTARATPGGEPGFAPLDLTFHYSIPSSLEGRVGPGHLVWVPFGPRRLQGVVLALTDTAPIAETRDLESLADPLPVLNPAQVALARWISQTYLAPLIDCVRLMLPPGVDRRAAATIDLAAGVPSPSTGGPGGLTPDQQAVIDLVRRRGRVRLRQVPRLLRRPGWRAAVDSLVRRGVLVRSVAMEPARVRPLIAQVVRLTADPVTLANPPIGRTSRPADVLAWLAQTDDPLPVLSEVCRAVGCTEHQVRTLAKQGLVRLTERRTLVMATLPPGEVDRVLASELSRAPKQAALLAALKTHVQPVELGELLRQTGAQAHGVRQLEARGYVRRVEEEPAIILNVPRQDVPTWLIRLRRAEVPARVLEFLQHEPAPVEVGVVYAETGATSGTLRALAEAGLIAIEEQEIWRDPLEGRIFVPVAPPELTPDQQTVLEAIIEGSRLRPEAQPEGLQVEGPESSNLQPSNLQPATAFLLHGVTGSGKTEIYLRAIDAALHRGRQAIVLVPEIALTPQTVRRFATRFPGQVTVWHSQLTLGERYDVWRRVRAGQINVVIGARSALFAPLPRLGLIVLDEEHEPSYKQQITPRYHAREAGLEYGRLTGATVVLGSATPDVTTYFRAQRGEFRLLELPRRILAHRDRERGDAETRRQDDRVTRRQGDRVTEESISPCHRVTVSPCHLPPVEVVDMRAELKAGNRSIFSRSLQQALTAVLAAGEQAILFLNRRGSATFVQCRDCGYVQGCPRCSTRLVYHRQAHALLCHHCGHRASEPDTCPQCGSRHIRFFGLGTQQVEDAVRELFPLARPIRWDRDTTGGRMAHELILEQFIRGQANVLVGTQMIAKGLDLPLVTLVGVVSADTALNLPDFRAGERTFQLLTQVAGRAGRSPLGGKVIVQTYTPENYAIQAASRHDYASFYRQEIAFRQEQGYPPFGRVIQLVYVHSSQARCQAQAETLARELQDRVARLGLSNLAVIGPAPAFLVRLRGLYRWQVILRGQDPHTLLRDLPLPLGWRVDVDPM
jgi:primosomal protein N' (replication factor Y)